MRTAAFTAIAAALALGPAFVLAEDDPDAMTCASFLTLAVEDQVAALSTLEPLGDEMNPTDAAASKDWAATVSAACRDHPERPLPEAARDALAD